MVLQLLRCRSQKYRVVCFYHLLYDVADQLRIGQRTLKLSGRGTLGSPTSIKTSEPLVRRASSKARTKKKEDGAEDSSEPPPAGKRRSPKGKKSQDVPKSQIVTFKYNNNELGQKISRIINGQESIDPPPNVKEPKEQIEKPAS